MAWIEFFLRQDLGVLAFLLRPGDFDASQIVGILQGQFAGVPNADPHDLAADLALNFVGGLELPYEDAEPRGGTRRGIEEPPLLAIGIGFEDCKPLCAGDDSPRFV